MSHHQGNRSNFLYPLIMKIAADRQLDYDYRIKEPSSEKPPMFRQYASYLLQDYRHKVCPNRSVDTSFLFLLF